MRYGGWWTAAILLIAVATWYALDIEAADLARGAHNAVLFVHDALPPRWDVWERGFPALLETLGIAYLGTLIGLVFSLPLAICAAANLVPVWLAAPTRWFLSAIRVLPALIWAAILVAIVGLGPLAGVLAIGLYSIGYLGKLQYEALEGLPAVTLDTADAMGLPRWQKVRHVVLPEAGNALLSQALFMFEYNVRATTIIGFVGAGGIGQLLMLYLQFLQFDRALALLVLVFLAVLLIDGASLRIRRRFIERRGPARQARWRDLVPGVRMRP